jgi:hypothetical protein
MGNLSTKRGNPGMSFEFAFRRPPGGLKKMREARKDGGEADAEGGSEEETGAE